MRGRRRGRPWIEPCAGRQRRTSNRSGTRSRSTRTNLQERAWAEACAGKLGAFDRSLRALDQRAKIVGIYRERGKPDWDGVKQPAPRESRPRPRRTWREPKDRLEPYGLEDQGGSTGLDDPNPFVVMKARDY
jgi:hypothetical protein